MTHDDPRHGNYLGYLTDGCRNECCRLAWRKYQNDRSRAIAYGRYEPRTHTDPTAARTKILELRGAGLSSRTIAASTGVASAIIELLEYGRKKWIYPATERRILAVSFNLDRIPAGRNVDASGTRRRIEALMLAGWSQGHIARALGVSRQRVSTYRAGAHVEAATARTIRDLFEQWWDKPGPEIRATNKAIREGFAPAAAWDDIDDPSATPDLGAETPRPHGGQGRPVAELVEDILWLLRHDGPLTAAQLAERFGYADKSAIQNALAADRGNRPDILAQLKRNAQLAA